MSTLSDASSLVRLDTDCVPEYGITIISYLDESGEAMFGYATHGDAPRSSLIGLLEMVGHDIMHDDGTV